MRTTGRKRLEREKGQKGSYRGGNGGKGRRYSKAVELSAPSRKGTPLDHYQPKKDKVAIPVHKLAKDGMTPRRIAKTLGVSLERVRTLLHEDTP